MTKSVNDLSLDAALDYTIDNINEIHLCAGTPATRAAAITGGGNNLATAALAGGTFVKANGDTSGRKYTCTPTVDASIAATGLADHVVKTSLTEILEVTELTASQTLTSGGTASIGAHDREIADPV